MGTGGRQALEGNYNCNYPNKEANNRRRFTPCRPHNGMVFVPRPFIPTFLFAASETSNLVKPTSFPSCQSSGSNLIQCCPSPPMKTVLQYTCEVRSRPYAMSCMHGVRILGSPRPPLCSKLGISLSLVTSCLRSLPKQPRVEILQRKSVAFGCIFIGARGVLCFPIPISSPKKWYLK